MRVYQAAELTLGLLIIPLVGLLVQELAVMLFPAVILAERHYGTNGTSNHLPVGLRNISDLVKFILLLPGSKRKTLSVWQGNSHSSALPLGLQSSKRAFSGHLEVPLRCPGVLEGLQAKAKPRAHLCQSLARAATRSCTEHTQALSTLQSFPWIFVTMSSINYLITSPNYGIPPVFILIT